MTHTHTVLRLALLVLACALLGAARPVRALSFTNYPAGDDVTPSLGQFQIVLDPAWQRIFDVIIPNSPLGSVLSTRHLRLYHRGVITSPTLYDPNTIIGRSDPFVFGGPEDTLGNIAGQAPIRTFIQQGQLLMHPSWAGPTNGTRGVHTFLKTMHLTDSITTRFGFSVKAGTLAPTRPVSAGQVEGGSLSNDFPARSFFNVFVQVDLPSGGILPPIQLVNVEPLLVQHTNITSFPPRLIYQHENPTAVSLYFNADCVIPDPIGGTNINVSRGTLFGQLTLAGHGVGFSHVEVESFQAEIENESATNSMPANATPIPSVQVEDFAPDYHAAPTSLGSGRFDDRGRFHFNASHLMPGGTNYLQVCTNLASHVWTTIATNVPSTNSFTFTDPDPTPRPLRFYRVTRTP